MRNPSRLSDKVLIVEDDHLAVDVIKNHLSDQGYTVAGVASSFQEAVNLYRRLSPDIVLIGFRLSGQKTGIDFAKFLQGTSSRPPFIYLVGKSDRQLASLAKSTTPAGFLSKPIHSGTLLSTVRKALFAARQSDTRPQNISIKSRGIKFLIPQNEICYLQADHVYVNLFLTEGRSLLQRSTLVDLTERLDEDSFVQTHRSYVVNLQHVENYDQQYAFVRGDRIPISRSRRPTFLAMFQQFRQRG